MVCAPQLFNAAAKGQIDEMKRYLAEGAKPDGYKDLSPPPALVAPNGLGNTPCRTSSSFFSGSTVF